MQDLGCQLLLLVCSPYRCTDTEKATQLYRNTRGVIHSLFECTNDFNEYLISGDYVSDFNDFKSLWYHLLLIVLGAFSKLHMIRIMFIWFQCHFIRFQTPLRDDSKSTDSISCNFLWFFMSAFLIPIEVAQISLANSPSNTRHLAKKTIQFSTADYTLNFKS